MTAFLVFNELSAIPLANSITAAQDRLALFSDLLIDQRIKGTKILVTPHHFLGLEIAAGYSVGRWLAEGGIEPRDKRVRIKTMLDRSIYYEACVGKDELENPDVEYRFGEETAQALFIAFSVQGLSISWLSGDRWDASSISFEKFWMDEHDVQSCAFTALHASRTTHLAAHGEWLRRQEPPPPGNGAELWNQREQLFPKIDFCSSVEEQIKNLAANAPRFKAVIRGLRDLQTYCDAWVSGNFDIHKLSNASGESQSTLNMYSEERTFRCPDGQYRVFEWHLKRADNTRIHFVDFPETKRLLVGYVGPHLRISTE